MEFDAGDFADADDSVENLPQAPKEKKKKKKKKAAPADTAETSLTGDSNMSNDLFDGPEEDDDGPAGRAQVASDYEKGASVFSDEDMKKCGALPCHPVRMQLPPAPYLIYGHLVIAQACP